MVVIKYSIMDVQYGGLKYSMMDVQYGGRTVQYDGCTVWWS